MSVGYDREPNIVNLGDTATVVAHIYDNADVPVAEVDLDWVSFIIQKPDGTRTTELAGDVTADGTGVLGFTDTDLIGPYTAVGTFVLLNGDILSSRADFEVIDPFKDETPSPSYVVAVYAWAKIEDCFDAEDEGPWLRDMTLNYFNKDKMESFIDEALFFINQQNPPTSLGVGSFVQDDSTVTADLPLLSQGVFIMVLRHLIRSYVEQPNPTGAQIAWQDRRDYMTRWQSVLQIEQEAFKQMLALYKRRFLGLGHGKVLVSAKAGRMLQAPMRTRFVGRGFW